MLRIGEILLRIEQTCGIRLVSELQVNFIISLTICYYIVVSLYLYAIVLQCL